MAAVAAAMVVVVGVLRCLCAPGSGACMSATSTSGRQQQTWADTFSSLAQCRFVSFVAVVAVCCVFVCGPCWLCCVEGLFRQGCVHRAAACTRHMRVEMCITQDIWLSCILASTLPEVSTPCACVVCCCCCCQHPLRTVSFRWTQQAAQEATALWR